MTDWRRSRVLAGLVIAAFLVVQLTVPISRFGEDAHRFGWQMFSSAGRQYDFSVATNDGEIEVDLEDYMAIVRADLDLTEVMPEHLCNVIPDAQRVTWRSGSHQC